MAGYSGTPLPQKLGIKPGLMVVTINAPANYRRLLGQIPDSVTFSERLKSGSSFVHLFTSRRSEIQKKMSILRDKISDNGAIWVSWPKKSSGISTDVTEDVIREIALPLGVVARKVRAADATRAGLKLMLGGAHRKP